MTRKNLSEDGRSPVKFANYRGHAAPDPRQPVGPNLLGEVLWPVSVEYDAEADRSRVGYSFAPPKVKP